MHRLSLNFFLNHPSCLRSNYASHCKCQLLWARSHSSLGRRPNLEQNHDERSAPCATWSTFRQPFHRTHFAKEDASYHQQLRRRFVKPNATASDHSGGATSCLTNQQTTCNPTPASPGSNTVRSLFGRNYRSDCPLLLMRIFFLQHAYCGKSMCNCMVCKAITFPHRNSSHSITWNWT